MEKQKPKPNYDKAMEQQIAAVVVNNKKPRLLLHSCCGPCSTAVLSRLQPYFDLTVFYYNPNLYPTQEYIHRLHEQKTVIKKLNAACAKQPNSSEIFVPTPIAIKTVKFQPDDYEKAVVGHERDGEGGARCYLCYLLRIKKTAQMAKRGKFDFFTTTLTVSPYKNAEWVNEIGQALSKEFGVAFLASDFKKQDGYKKSIQFSKEMNLYRQDYCGCRYSLQEQSSQENTQEENYKG